MKTSGIFIALVFLMISCSSRHSTPAEPPTLEPTVNEYFPLTDGNYWVYQVIKQDSAGQFLPPYGNLDSIAVAGDTLVGGDVYKKIYSSQLPLSLMRISDGYLMNELGDKLFSVNDDFGYLIDRPLAPPDTSLTQTTRLATLDSIAVVPAGVFTARYVQGTVTSTDAGQWGWEGEKHFYGAYARGVGRVCRSAMWIPQGFSFEERLVRFKVVSAN